MAAGTINITCTVQRMAEGTELEKKKGKQLSVGFLILAQIFVVFWGFVASVRLVWEVIKHPIESFKKTKRDTPPNCLLDPSLGTHEYVTANGVKFHCVRSGDKSKPMMLFLHGFPEFWYSWRHQIREFNKHYHVVAVDLRGYGESDRPPNKLDYTIANLRRDVAELIPALGFSKCVLVGHDWGGAIAWSVAHRHPELVEKLVVMNCPHPKIMRRTLTGTWAQFMKSWYMLMFQIPKLPELIFQMRDYSYFNAIFRSRKAGVCHRENFPSETVEVYKYVFSQPGALTPPINYIRCIFNMNDTKGPSRGPIACPTLLIWGDKDAFMESSMADEHREVATDLTVKHIPDCSHWVQQDLPDRVNELMKEFLEVEE